MTKVAGFGITSCSNFVGRFSFDHSECSAKLKLSGLELSRLLSCIFGGDDPEKLKFYAASFGPRVMVQSYLF